MLLLVDDDESLRESLADILEDCHFSILKAKNLAEGRQHLATQPVSILISDVTLPDGSGVQWAAEIRQSHPQLRILIMTGLAESDLPVIPAGITVLTKPVDPRQLISLLR